MLSFVSNSVQPHGLQPARLLRPWDSPGKTTGVGCHFLLQCMKVESESEGEVAQLCLTLSNPMDCSLPGSSVHGIFQARVLEWGAIAFSYCLLFNLKTSVLHPSWWELPCNTMQYHVPCITVTRPNFCFDFAFTKMFRKTLKIKVSD